MADDNSLRRRHGQAITSTSSSSSSSSSSVLFSASEKQVAQATADRAEQLSEAGGRRRLRIWGSWLRGFDIEGASLPGGVDSIAEIACGASHVSVLLNSGKVSAMGVNLGGCCGVQHSEDTTHAAATASPAPAPAGSASSLLLRSFYPVLLPTSISINSVVAGAYHTLFLSSLGAVFACGRNDFGQLGHSPAKSTTFSSPVLLSFPALAISSSSSSATTDAAVHHSVRMVHMSTNARHSAFCDVSGNLWTCGDARFGKLGYIDSNESVQVTSENSTVEIAIQSEPKIVEQWDPSVGRPSIKSSSCGYHFTLALSELGHVFSFGLNVDGALGLGLPSNSEAGTAGKKVELEERIVVPRILDSLAQQSSMKRISCGHSHAFAVSNGGRLAAWGSGLSCALGIGSIRSESAPYWLKKFRAIKIAQIVTANTHAAALSTAGYLYSWGVVENGATGHRNADEQANLEEWISRQGKPTAADDQIPQAAAFANRQLVPVEPKQLDSGRVLKMATGAYCTAVLYEERSIGVSAADEMSVEEVKPMLGSVEHSKDAAASNSERPPWRQPLLLLVALLALLFVFLIRSQIFSFSSSHASL
jgi:alpha-tubulin suppressor-like RCC1 family protein